MEEFEVPLTTMEEFEVPLTMKDETDLPLITKEDTDVPLIVKEETDVLLIVQEEETEIPPNMMEQTEVSLTATEEFEISFHVKEETEVLSNATDETEVPPTNDETEVPMTTKDEFEVPLKASEVQCTLDALEESSPSEPTREPMCSPSATNDDTLTHAVTSTVQTEGGIETLSSSRHTIEPLEETTTNSQNQANNTSDIEQIGSEESSGVSTRALGNRLSVIKYVRRKMNTPKGSNAVTPVRDESENKELALPTDVHRNSRWIGRGDASVMSTQSSVSRRSLVRSFSRVLMMKRVTGGGRPEEESVRTNSETVKPRKKKKKRSSNRTKDSSCEFDSSLFFDPLIEACTECSYFFRVLGRCVFDHEMETRERRYGIFS